MFQLYKMKIFRDCLHNNVTIFNTAELHTEKWLRSILCCVFFTATLKNQLHSKLFKILNKSL